MDSDLRRDCRSLLKHLQRSQQLLNNKLADSFNCVSANGQVDGQAAAVTSSEARNKLLSLSRPDFENNQKVTLKGDNENRYNKCKGYSQVISRGDTVSDVLPTDLDNTGSVQNSVKSAPDNLDILISSTWLPASPNTQHKRNLIARHTHVPNKLGLEDLQDLEKERRLNFSYSHIGAEHDKCEANVFPVSILKNKKPGKNDGFLVETNIDNSSYTENPQLLAINSFGDTSKMSKNESNSEQKLSGQNTAKSSEAEESFRKQLEDDGNNRQLNSFIRNTTVKPKSILNSKNYSLYNLSRGKRNVASSRSGQESLPDQRLLGYDWIAALLDNDSELIDQSESFFNELREFRKAYQDECSNKFYMEGPHTLVDFEPEPIAEILKDPKVEPFTVNERLFTEPLKQGLVDYDDGIDELAGTVNKKQPTRDHPRFVRVSIPRSTLSTPYRMKFHRRSSFDSSDSCSLRDHCLLGWKNTVPTALPSAQSVDLNSAAGTGRDCNKMTLAEAERLATAHSDSLWPFHKPTPRLQMLSLWQKQYKNLVTAMSLPASTRGNNSASEISSDSDSIKKITNQLLNSTYATMFEMDRLKEQRRLESLWSRPGQGEIANV